MVSRIAPALRAAFGLAIGVTKRGYIETSIVLNIATRCGVEGRTILATIARIEHNTDRKARRLGKESLPSTSQKDSSWQKSTCRRSHLAVRAASCSAGFRKRATSARIRKILDQLQTGFLWSWRSRGVGCFSARRKRHWRPKELSGRNRRNNADDNGQHRQHRQTRGLEPARTAAQSERSSTTK